MPKGNATMTITKLMGERIRTFREARNWSQSQLADLSGLSHAALNRIENGQRLPRAATLESIANALGVSLDSFVQADEIELVNDEVELERQLLAEFRSSEDKEEVLALIRAFNLVRKASRN